MKVQIGLIQRYPLLVIAFALAPSGCRMPSYDLDRIKEQLAQRPVELNRLDQLAGKWKTSGTIKFIGIDEPIHTTGTSEAAWECDGRLLVERSQFDMGPLGPMSGLSVWSWDENKRRYGMQWFDSFGEQTRGHARYDEDTKTWHISTRGRSSLCNVATRGTVRVIDHDTLEWTWDQWDAWGILQFAEMRGMSQRH